MIGCAASIDRDVPFQESAIEVNRSEKKDVINSIGLPDKIKRGKEGTEYWYYFNGATDTISVVPMIIPGVATVPISVKHEEQDKQRNNADFIFVFDNKNILIDLIKRKK